MNGGSARIADVILTTMKKIILLIFSTRRCVLLNVDRDAVNFNSEISGKIIEKLGFWFRNEA